MAYLAWEASNDPLLRPPFGGLQEADQPKSRSPEPYPAKRGSKMTPFWAKTLKMDLFWTPFGPPFWSPNDHFAGGAGIYLDRASKRGPIWPTRRLPEEWVQKGSKWTLTKESVSFGHMGQIDRFRRPFWSSQAEYPLNSSGF